MRKSFFIFVTFILIFLFLGKLVLGFGAREIDTSVKSGVVYEKWVGAWSTSLQPPFDKGVSHNGFENQTIRSIVHPHISGKKIRLRFSNKYGNSPLVIQEIHVADSLRGYRIDSKTSQPVLFNENQTIIIPPGDRVVSDPLNYDVKNGEDIAVSIFVRDLTGPTTWHPRSLQPSYISSNGNYVAKNNGFKIRERAWFWLEGIDVIPSQPTKGAVVILGDSIANGNGSSIAANHRWPDFLSNRLNNANNVDNNMSVLNAGISSNQLLRSVPKKGDHALERLDRDVLNQTGAQAVILHLGINDIRYHPNKAIPIIKRMKEVIKETHKAGMKIYGGTLTPFKGSNQYTEEGERTRQIVNQWIRNSGEFDGVIDFDKALRDPIDSERLFFIFDSGDHLHPNDLGYMRMAMAVDLGNFF